MPRQALRVIDNPEFDRSANTASAMGTIAGRDTASVAGLAGSIGPIGAPAPTEVYNLRAADFVVATPLLGAPLLAATEAADKAAFVGIVSDAASTHDDQTLGDDMAGPTREEYDAKLAAAEARSETRFVELSGKIDRLSDAVATFASNVRAQLTDARREAREELTDARREVREENVFTRWTVVIAVVTSLIGAIAALWVTQSNLLSAFTAGLTLRTETKEAPSAPPSPAPAQRSN